MGPEDEWLECAFLRRIVRQAANMFDQESLYLSVAGIVEFVRGTEEDGFLV
jgi:hypothetical protein